MDTQLPAGEADCEVGQLVMDTRYKAVGRIMGDDAGRYLLRGTTGGREWICPRGASRPLTAEEQARVERARTARTPQPRVGGDLA